MSAVGARIGLVLLTISAVTGCGDEPLTSTSSRDLGEGAVAAIHAGGKWKASWASAPEDYVNSGNPLFSFSNQTIREGVHTSIGGPELRIRFTNLYGAVPLHIDGAHVALKTSGSGIAPDSDREILFGGSSSATIPAGADLWSDAVKLHFDDQADLAVSIYLASSTPVGTFHTVAGHDNFVVTGNALSASSLPGAQTLTTATQVGVFASSYFISGVDVKTHKKTEVVAVFGASTEDGIGATPNGNDGYVAVLARLLDGEVGVLNLGMGANRLLYDFPIQVFGQRGVLRFSRDVLGQSGVTHALLGLGNADIIFGQFFPDPNAGPFFQNPTVEQLEAASEDLLARCAANGVTCILQTLMPCKGYFFCNQVTEAKRQAYNDWVRGGGHAVADLDAVLRDPGDPAAILPAYDSGDHLHPNPAGHAALAAEAKRALHISDD
jgi:lysophospholipase L1-like esterase